MSDNLLKYPASFKAEANVESAGTIEAVPYGDMLQNYYALYASETRKIRIPLSPLNLLNLVHLL